VGVYDTEESGEGNGLLTDRVETWTTGSTGVDHWLAASIPGWTNVGLLESFYQSRYLSNQGRLFFNSSDSLVPRDVNNGKADVYEYEPVGVGGCQVENTKGGCVALISSGESSRESTFVDASESGNDVFFLTASKLAPSDIDTTFDLYDARVCKAPGAEACASAGSAPPPPCSGEACKAPASSPPTYGTPASSTFSGSGNVAPNAAGVLGSKSTSSKAKPLTQAQKLAAALKLCKKDKQKKKRVACEKAARKRYPAKKASKGKGASAKRASATTPTSRTKG
jgi:hypothetical protein